MSGRSDYRHRQTKKPKKGAKKPGLTSVLPLPTPEVEVIKRPRKKKEEEEAEA